MADMSDSTPNLPAATQTTPEDAIQAALPAVNPKALAEAIEDPSVFPEIARGDFYIFLCRMRERMQNPNTPVQAMLDYGKLLAKIGKLDTPELVAPGTGATIIFNIPQMGNTPAEKVIVSQAPITLDVSTDDD